MHFKDWIKVEGMGAIYTLRVGGDTGVVLYDLNFLFFSPPLCHPLQLFPRYSFCMIV